jgi:hypothetical protein
MGPRFHRAAHNDPDSAATQVGVIRIGGNSQLTFFPPMLQSRGKSRTPEKAGNCRHLRSRAGLLVESFRPLFGDADRSTPSGPPTLKFCTQRRARLHLQWVPLPRTPRFCLMATFRQDWLRIFADWGLIWRNGTSRVASKAAIVGRRPDGNRIAGPRERLGLGEHTFSCIAADSCILPDLADRRRHRNGLACRNSRFDRADP